MTDPNRSQHPRDEGPHIDDDLDAVIRLAEAIGVYTEGQSLHEVLVAIENRISTLENG